jgi:hypothetical protein
MNQGDGMFKIRTTNQPDKEIEVDEAELLDLYRQGFVKEMTDAPKSIKDGDKEGESR